MSRREALRVESEELFGAARLPLVHTSSPRLYPVIYVASIKGSARIPLPPPAD